jgi:tetratricopeptide (TPR) repeat protein
MKSARVGAVVLLGVVLAWTIRVAAVGAEDRAAKEIYPKVLRASAWVVTPTGSGTGWVIDRSRRLLVTNQHVVQNHHTVSVVFPAYLKGRVIAERRHYTDRLASLRIVGRVIDVDVERDLALIQADSLPEGAVELKLAKQSASPGESVHSVGNPGASEALWVYTSGRARQVYRKEWRYNDGKRRQAMVLETQSPTNPGDSGGPVVNEQGEIVAVVAGNRVGAVLMHFCIDVSEARVLLGRAGRLLAPKTAADYNERGWRYHVRGLQDLAIADFTTAIDKNARLAWAYANRGCAFFEKGDLAAAIKDSSAALDLDAKNVRAVNTRGRAYLRQKKYDAAIKNFTKAIRLAPKDPAYYHNRAVAYENKKNHKRALDDYQKALGINPRFDLSHFNRGDLCERLGMFKESEQHYRAALGLNPAYGKRLKVFDMRLLRIHNHTNQHLRVTVRYETRVNGEWRWMPVKQEESIWKIGPGKDGVLTHNGDPVCGRRVVLSAVSKKTRWAQTSVTLVEEKDGKYLSQRMQTTTWNYYRKK